MRLVHLSDLHHQLDWRCRSLRSSGWRGLLGRFELQGLGRSARFANARQHIETLLSDVHAIAPDHVILTGDLTSLGHEDELYMVREWLEPLLKARKVTIVPGNHDRYTDSPAARGFERIFGTETDWPEYAGPRGYPFVRLIGDDLAIIGLDSTRVGALSQYFVGRLGREQLTALGHVLDDPRLQKRVVLVMSHHGPLGPSANHHSPESGLLDAKKFLQVLHGRNTVLFHGHSHLRTWHRAVASRPHIFGGGSSTERGHEGYWLLDVDTHDRLEARHLGLGRRPAD